MLYVIGMIALIYVYDLLLFGPGQNNIDEVIKELEDSGISFTVEENVYPLSVVEVNTNKHSGKVTIPQGLLTKKFLNTVVVLYSNNKTTPSATVSLGTDAYGPPFDETWYYASVMLMLVYLSSNSRSDIHFAVPQYSRFTHNPRKSCYESVNSIFLCLVGTQGQG